ADFRVWLHEHAAHLPDTALRRAFLARYPTAAAFDARALKEFLMLNAETRVLGIDSFRAVYHAMNASDRGKDPNPDYLPGAPLAHEPWNFAIATGFPGPVETYAPDNAQMYTDLAELAALDGRAPWRPLSALYAGNVMHFVADVGNAVHTVQVGIYPIFVDATIQSYILKVVHLWGLLGTPPTRNKIGIDIITNLHTLSEQLFEAQLIDALRKQDSGDSLAIRASMRGALHGLARGDDSLARAIRDTLGRLDS